jgi:hypothetical protein
MSLSDSTCVEIHFIVNSNRECYALEMLSNDCSAVANLVPNGRVKDSFTEACNWHQICYTCVSIC